MTTELHFMVDFGGMTDRAREFWAEGKYEQAMKLLCEGFHLSRHQAGEVISGKKRMAQYPGGREGCEGTLVDDDWKPKDSGFSFYPDVADSPFAGVVAAQKREIEDLKAEIEELREAQFNSEEARRERTDATLRSMSRRLGLPTTPIEFLTREQELDSRPTPKPDTTYKPDNGWVTRDGKFYPCNASMEHIWLAGRLGKTEAEAENAGWVKLAAPMLGIYVISQKKPTQRQINTVFAWAAVRPGLREKVAKEWLDCWNAE